MYRRKSKPDLLFMLTVFVCVGVLVTGTVNAAEERHWGINLSTETGCGEAIGEWQGCSSWLADTQRDEPAPYRAALRLGSEEHPGLDVVWYYTQAEAKRRAALDYDLSDAYLHDQLADRSQFGVVIKRQYQHFGLSLGVEAKRFEVMTDEPLLYFSLSNRW